jgi:NAD(P)-dependent dehydrogenase (short-subunit alcohol dehydrogenase family)
MTSTIVITGASRGLGEAVARAAAQMGANVVLSARSVDRLEKVAAQIRQEGGVALVAPADIGRLEDCQYLIQQAIMRFGRLDALVNNAGILEPVRTIADTRPAEWLQNLTVNVLGPMMVTQAALPYLRMQQGRVIHVSSGAAERGVAGWAAYCVSKGGLNQFNRVLAIEEPQITTMAVRPGVVDSEMQAVVRREGAGVMAESEHARFIAYHKQSELLDPEVPGRAIAVLALHAPREWSGAFVNWNDPEVEQLVAGPASITRQGVDTDAV